MTNEQDAPIEHDDWSNAFIGVARMLVSVALIGGLIVLALIFAVAVV